MPYYLYVQSGRKLTILKCDRFSHLPAQRVRSAPHYAWAVRDAPKKAFLRVTTDGSSPTQGLPLTAARHLGSCPSQFFPVVNCVPLRARGVPPLNHISQQMQVCQDYLSCCAGTKLRMRTCRLLASKSSAAIVHQNIATEGHIKK